MCASAGRHRENVHTFPNHPPTEFPPSSEVRFPAQWVPRQRSRRTAQGQGKTWDHPHPPHMVRAPAGALKTCEGLS